MGVRVTVHFSAVIKNLLHYVSLPVKFSLDLEGNHLMKNDDTFTLDALCVLLRPFIELSHS